MEGKAWGIPGNFKLIFAEPKGFCFGVRRAISNLEDALASYGRVYALGSPIHNPQEIERLRSQGLVIIEEPEDLPPGEVVFVRAHGVPAGVLEVLGKAGAVIIDGTCPFVSKAQEKAAILAREGYLVMILGDRDHPEVQAIRQSTDGPVIVVSPSEPFIFHEKEFDRVGIVAQTTLQRETLSRLVSTISGTAAELRVFNTICGATSARQKAMASLAGSVDGIIVIGGRNSANTAKLAEIAANSGTPTLWIEDEDELEGGWFKGKKTIGIAAGASTPDWLIRKIETRLASAKSAGEDGWEND